jgi:hypothetical protein
MKFKLNMECEFTVSRKDAMSYWGTTDPEEVAEKEIPGMVELLDRNIGMFKKIRVTIKPIS